MGMLFQRPRNSLCADALSFLDGSCRLFCVPFCLSVKYRIIFSDLFNRAAGHFCAKNSRLIVPGASRSSNHCIRNPSAFKWSINFSSHLPRSLIIERTVFTSFFTSGLSAAIVLKVLIAFSISIGFIHYSINSLINFVYLFGLPFCEIKQFF